MDLKEHFDSMFAIKILDDNKVKIIYQNSEPIRVSIGLRLTGTEHIVEDRYFDFYTTNHWYTPDFDFRGCSKMTIINTKTKEIIIDWVIPPRLSKSAKKQNLICLGLNKAGTTSFRVSTQNLGYEYFPVYPAMTSVLPDVIRNDYSKLESIVKNPRFNAYTDLPFSLPKVYEKLYEISPESIFVLTVRESTEKWVNSAMSYFGWLMDGRFSPENIPNVLSTYEGFELKKVSNFIMPMISSWGITNFENLEDQLRMVYENHTNDCLEFFHKKRINNFTMLDVSREGELKKFTDWLNVDNQIENFVWENKTSL